MLCTQLIMNTPAASIIFPIAATIADGVRRVACGRGGRASQQLPTQGWHA